MSYVVLAKVPVKPEFMDAAKATVSAILPETRAEAGCELFALHDPADTSSALIIYERWRDRDAFDFHHAQAYTREVYRHYENWLAGPVSITELRDID